MFEAVYDLEIKNEASTLPNKWKDHYLMGISVLCVFDYRTESYLFFNDSNKERFLKDYYQNPECNLISFNGIDFDNKVIESNWSSPDLPIIEKHAPEFDILQAVWRSLNNGMGYAPAFKFHKGVNLNDLSIKTLGRGKNGEAALAPELFSSARYAELYTYCLHDVRLTKELFDFICENGYVVSPLKGEIQIELPFRRGHKTSTEISRNDNPSIQTDGELPADSGRIADKPV